MSPCALTWVRAAWAPGAPNALDNTWGWAVLPPKPLDFGGSVTIATLPLLPRACSRRLRRVCSFLLLTAPVRGAAKEGGGIHVASALPVIIRDSRFELNRAQFGGGMYIVRNARSGWDVCGCGWDGSKKNVGSGMQRGHPMF